MTAGIDWDLTFDHQGPDVTADAPRYRLIPEDVGLDRQLCGRPTYTVAVRGDRLVFGLPSYWTIEGGLTMDEAVAMYYHLYADRGESVPDPLRR